MRPSTFVVFTVIAMSHAFFLLSGGVADKKEVNINDICLQNDAYVNKVEKDKGRLEIKTPFVGDKSRMKWTAMLALFGFPVSDTHSKTLPLVIPELHHYLTYVGGGSNFLKVVTEEWNAVSQVEKF